MDGIHDMGGMHGFGRIDVEDNEPVFHADWEGRFFAIAVMVESFVEGTNVDSGRHANERIDPATYLNSSYYERWLHSVESLIVDSGVCSREEIDARVQELGGAAG